MRGLVTLRVLRQYTQDIEEDQYVQVSEMDVRNAYESGDGYGGCLIEVYDLGYCKEDVGCMM